MGPIVPEILQSRENKMNLLLCILFGAILLLLAEKRTERLSNHGLISVKILIVIGKNGKALFSFLFLLGKLFVFSY